MRVLHINCNYLGTTLHQTMIDKLNKINLENEVYVPVYDKNNSVIKPNDFVTVSECFKKWDRFNFNYKQKKILKDIEQKLSIKTYDIIHAYTLFTDGNCAMTLSKKYGIPFVVAIRNTDVNDFFRFRFFLRSRGIEILKNASAVFFLSNAYKKEIFNKYIPDDIKDNILKKSFIIPNGIDDFWISNRLSKYKELPDSLNKLKLIYVGKIDRNKNIIGIQKALKQLRSDGLDVTLTIVGKVIDKKLFLKIKKDKFIKYEERKPKEKLIEYYRMNDIFVMPSHKETFGLVYAEAMSQGLPVIYSEGQGFDEQFEEGIVGYHVNSKDYNDIAKKIKLILQKYSYISDNCLQNITRFKWEKIVKEYKKIYINCKKNSC